MLKELSPVIHRQARTICRNHPEVIEDAYQEARIKLWALLEQGHRERPYLLAATKNCIIDTYRRERRQPQRLEPFPTAGGDEHDPLEGVAAPGEEIGELETTIFITSRGGSLRRALIKLVFTDEAMTGAERVALCRARMDLQDSLRGARN
jgi:DNA-directed RNA polymerase specialized sigma24 family protein